MCFSTLLNSGPADPQGKGTAGASDHSGRLRDIGTGYFRALEGQATTLALVENVESGGGWRNAWDK